MTVRIDREDAADAEAVAGLIARAFGPGRFAKTAERLREGNHAALALVAREGEAVVGCVRLWPIRVGGAEALLLGPFAVEASHRDQGLGAELIEAACERARAAGWRHVLLVGDEPYYGRFGFTLARDVSLPGPVDPRRVLARPLGEATPLSGEVTLPP
jgi:predicted N-acetyltransferase YhbS